MSDIREDIYAAVQSRLQGISTGSGYRTTIDTVEVCYEDPSQVSPASRPYIGIVFLREDYNDEPGKVVTLMRLALACYVTSAAATPASVAAALSNLVADVRKALYADPPNLNIDGVIMARVFSRQGTEGEKTLALKKDGASLIEIGVKFYEASNA